MLDGRDLVGNGVRAAAASAICNRRVRPRLGIAGISTNDGGQAWRCPENLISGTVDYLSGAIEPGDRRCDAGVWRRSSLPYPRHEGQFRFMFR